MNKLYRVLIFLIFFGLGIPCASAANVTSFIPQTVEMDMGLSQNIEIMKDDVSDGTSGSNNRFSALNSEVAEINMEPALTASNENGTNSKSATVNVANPINWEFSPQEPVCGDTININGSASAGEKINAVVTFEKNVSVLEGEYEYSLQNVTIVKGLGNTFTVEARGVTNLNVRAKKVIWLSKSANASGDTAIVSRSNVPTGTYQIMIDGDAKEGVSEVDLKITASQTIQADSNGNFSYSYNTTAVPPGNFEVKVGDTTKEITLRSKEEPVLPVADFSANISEGYAPLSVQFNDSSKNATSVSWNFGDGTANSDERNPMHIYSAAGNYNVNLTASNENGTNSKSATINVTNPTDWNFSPQEPVCGNTININGSASAGEKINAVVTFEKNVSVLEGEYEYSLQNVTIVKGLGNTFTVEARGVTNLNVRAKKVIWLSKSANASGDTAIVSRANVPTGTYQIMIDGDAKEGVSEVDLKITASQTIQADSNGNFSYSYNTTAVPPGNFEVKVGDITKEITLRSKEEPVLPVADFNANISEGYVPLSVQFNDSSKNATSVSWNFGDGTANSDERNPMHIYSAAGNYNVNLTASNEYGMNSTSVIINVFENKPFPGYTNPPIDSDHDNLYEDINGNGNVDFDDVVAYYANMNWIGKNAPVTLFDYNNNGLIDFDDVVKLYNLI